MRRATVLIALVAALSLAACGEAEEETLDPVAQAAAATTEAGTAEITFDAEYPDGVEVIPVKGRGVISTSGPTRGTFALHMYVDGDRVKLDEIVDRGVVYVGGADLAKDLPAGKDWAKVDLARIARKAGVDPGAIDGGASLATDVLGFLRGAGSVKELGEDTVMGVHTRYYRAIVDPRKVVRQTSGSGAEAALRKLGENLDGEMSIDVWIDGDQRVRREAVVYPRLRMSETPQTKFTIEFVRFGVPLKLEIPPRDQVTDITDEILKSG